MSSGTEAGTPQPEGLQFDHAEFEQALPASISCAACKRPIVENYYEIGGAIVCEPCRTLIDSQLRGGSGFVRFLRALAFGTGAAAVGTLAYAGFIRATKIDFGLVSILVGYLIGRAVRAGSRNRGGLPYQLLAVLLTYLAVGVTYTTVFFMLHQPMANPGMPDSGLATVILFVVLSVIMPVMSARENVITIAIVGFALWQAWKMNVRLKLPVSGPFRVGDSGPAGSAEGASSHA